MPLLILRCLGPCTETHKSYLNGSTSTVFDTWLVSSKGRDSEEWTGETRFKIEGRALVPAQAPAQQFWTSLILFQPYRLKRM